MTAAPAKAAPLPEPSTDALRSHDHGSHELGSQELGNDAPADIAFGNRYGLLARQKIQLLAHRDMIRASQPIIDSQFQPASLDLRLGHRAYRVRASFLPGQRRTVQEQLDALSYDEINLEDGAVLERGCVYVVPLLESLHLQESISAAANISPVEASFPRLNSRIKSSNLSVSAIT